MAIYENITELIGNTRLSNWTVLFLAERQMSASNSKPSIPGSSVNRIAWKHDWKLEADGLIKPGDATKQLVEHRDWLNMVGAAKGYKVVIVMPETMSVERKIIQASMELELFVLTLEVKEWKALTAKAARKKWPSSIWKP